MSIKDLKRHKLNQLVSEMIDPIENVSIIRGKAEQLARGGLPRADNDTKTAGQILLIACELKRLDDI